MQGGAVMYFTPEKLVAYIESGGIPVNLLTVGSLFSGIGGFELGLERTGGFKTAWQCEKDEFCLKVLAKHWPDVKRFTDIKEMGIEENIPYVDVICGGFPCQPVSCAGKRKGAQDERWLWPEFYRIICEVKPRWVLVENVPGLLSADSGRLFAGILRDLASSGYDAEWNIVSAASVGAPHLRKRVFLVAHAEFRRISSFGAGEMEAGTSSAIIHSSETPGVVAHPDQIGRHGRAGRFWQGRGRESQDSGEKIADTVLNRLESIEQTGTKARPIDRDAGRWAVEPDVGRVANGVPARVDRLRVLGNAIVPQCAEYVGRCILEAEAQQ